MDASMLIQRNKAIAIAASTRERQKAINAGLRGRQTIIPQQDVIAIDVGNMEMPIQKVFLGSLQLQIVNTPPGYITVSWNQIQNVSFYVINLYRFPNTFMTKYQTNEGLSFQIIPPGIGKYFVTVTPYNYRGNGLPVTSGQTSTSELIDFNADLILAPSNIQLIRNNYEPIFICIPDSTITDYQIYIYSTSNLIESGTSPAPLYYTITSPLSNLAFYTATIIPVVYGAVGKSTNFRFLFYATPSLPIISVSLPSNTVFNVNWISSPTNSNIITISPGVTIFSNSTYITSNTRFAFSNVRNSRLYTATITPYNNGVVGPSNVSLPIQFYTTPYAPAKLSLTSDGASLTANWLNREFVTSNIIRFYNNSQTLLISNVVSYPDTYQSITSPFTLSNNISYSFSLIPYNNYAIGPSNATSLKVFLPPPSPTNISIVISPYIFNTYWSPSSNTTSYLISLLSNGVIASSYTSTSNFMIGSNVYNSNLRYSVSITPFNNSIPGIPAISSNITYQIQPPNPIAVISSNSSSLTASWQGALIPVVTFDGFNLLTRFVNGIPVSSYTVSFLSNGVIFQTYRGIMADSLTIPFTPVPGYTYSASVIALPVV